MKIQKWDHLLAANVDPNFRLTEANTIDFPEYCSRIQYEYTNVSSLFVFLFCIKKKKNSHIQFSKQILALNILNTEKYYS